MSQPEFLIEFIQSLRLKSTLLGRSHLAAPWGFFQNALSEMTFHYLIDGECYLWLGGAPNESLRLTSGDLVLLPRGSAHGVASSPTAYLCETDRICYAIERERGRFLTGEGRESRFLCGTFALGRPGADVLLRSLPELVVIHLDDSPQMSWIRSTLRLVEHETHLEGPGQDFVLAHLLGVLFMQIFRWCLDSPDCTRVGLLGAISDPDLCPAMTAIMGDVRYPWQLHELAEIAGLSRSAFAERFTKTVGETPMAFLRMERLRRSVTLLEAEDLSVKEVANRVGFSRVEVFIRSFERTYGCSPSKHRTRLQAMASVV